ncbi:1-(5-phosphoribosyl)-5-[(5-phosphoribosylamino)methylideneamino] imidazole-4-carboxamide isomerase [Hyphobacterium sp. HN65]|uniref:1-(5-phosphoribosyl)-5-[(5-phosphoribosylamino)methylideneamino] imidazole-4-carboxamide isomerase n=1 Tax=Hyphobacterium lacteum TaxID=3116575 RepID=A0ABU7LSF0_9PROT|nr:1-(5-phosphoribosyl)-5-[(5-phosphoribosylamino)methylideneamino] imidazole-4-carboxamide isomerase [Hyphobacterium sp. HN65]MEE2526823.1 1-(5-phosphoribosyl)-5-[(5-phosphoribosylamino)methylideneamino] imidazole-4-carboxamide isomerase [Hyphobacterium sp. HN65]
MILYPAIDLLDGDVVRLSRGDFATAKTYSMDPAAMATTFAGGGASWLHVVDLSGARDGTPRQSGLIGQLSLSGLRIQAGGGIRTGEDISRLLDAGVERAIIGSRAIEQPELVARWLAEFGPDRLVAALDLRLIDGKPDLVTDGWTKSSGKGLEDVLSVLVPAGLRHALVTDVGRDGLLSGPNTALYAQLKAGFPDIDWQASGGVSQLSDLAALKATGIAGAITGRALYENRFSLTEALACLQDA